MSKLDVEVQVVERKSGGESCSSHLSLRIIIVTSVSITTATGKLSRKRSETVQ